MRINYWLMKSEPSTWSWKNQVDEVIAMWDGVRNYQARNNLMKMKKGDLCFFYHSVVDKSVVGVVEVVKEYYTDPTDKTGKFGMVDFKALFPVKNPVSLAQIKAEPRLIELALIRQSRLSVVPVSPTHWKILNVMAGIKA